MDIVIIGAGNVGTALGTAFGRLGHRVRFAVRDTAAREGAVPVAGCGEGADLVVLAVPFAAAADAVAAADLPEGTVVVDATNPFGAPLPDGAESGAAWVAAHAPGVKVVKAFNVLGAESMTAPEFPAGRALLPVAGDDPQARATVRELAAAMGFDAVEVGGLGSAHLMEEAARYWGLLAYAGGLGRGFVLGALTRNG